MKTLKTFLLFSMALFVCASCTSSGDDEEVTPEVQEFTITATSTSDSIDLSWTDVEGVSWYFVNYGTTGEDKTITGGYQNLNTEQMSYTLSNLESNTTYEIFIEGNTFLSGGELVARSNTITVMTEQ